MKSEYLLLNLLILIGPLVMSFEPQIRFVRSWRHAWPAIILVAVPYLIWDALVTGRHWWFNPQFTFAPRIFGLPLEECLFFGTVPFAALFMWETIKFYFPHRKNFFGHILRTLLLLGTPLGIFLFLIGKEYTGLMLLALSCSAIFDMALRTELFMQTRLVLYLLSLALVTFVFNGYLTARPVVLYNEQYQLGVRVGTIPLEDFGYGFSLVLLVTIIYEKFKTSVRGGAHG